MHRTSIEPWLTKCNILTIFIDVVELEKEIPEVFLDIMNDDPMLRQVFKVIRKSRTLIGSMPNFDLRAPSIGNHFENNLK